MEFSELYGYLRSLGGEFYQPSSEIFIKLIAGKLVDQIYLVDEETYKDLKKHCPDANIGFNENLGAYFWIVDKDEFEWVD